MFPYIKTIYWTYKYYHQVEKEEFVLDNILYNVKNGGCVLIKFVQWLLPILEINFNIDTSIPENEWFVKLESVYDDCFIHPIEYTKKSYKNSFNKGLEEDYEIVDIIGSGSIGQVYKIKNKHTYELYALKCTHPAIGRELFFVNCVLQILYNTPYISKKLKYLIPIDLRYFIDDFRNQTNMINEANNGLFFSRKYKHTDLIIIPEIISVSKDILIMSYEEGESFETIEIPFIDKTKVAYLLKYFIKNNDQYLQYMHGDIHKGNWKVKYNADDKISVVIYDFGYCWNIPETYKNYADQIKTDQQKDIEYYFTHLKNSNLWKINKEFVDNLIILVRSLLVDKDGICNIPIEDMESLIDVFIDSSKELTEVSFFIKKCLETCSRYQILMDIFVLQYLILLNQVEKTYSSYIENSSETYKHLFSSMEEIDNSMLNRDYDFLSYMKIFDFQNTYVYKALYDVTQVSIKDKQIFGDKDGDTESDKEHNTLKNLKNNKKFTIDINSIRTKALLSNASHP